MRDKLAGWVVSCVGAGSVKPNSVGRAAASSRRPRGSRHLAFPLNDPYCWSQVVSRPFIRENEIGERLRLAGIVK